MLHKYFTKKRKWLFQHENFAAAAVFDQKDAAWPQGRKENFVKLPFDRKTPKSRKPL